MVEHETVWWVLQFVAGFPVPFVLLAYVPELFSYCLVFLCYVIIIGVVVVVVVLV